ncbi:VacB and RNase II family 3'-5' exoribonuclease [Allomyces macrogynus ATCC 38327]|uniref:DIS3-like exonuclease 2 n=1 Tax=Allomyces macrogynus (strain ATCC 38327) TaxID=578462 RepID=A0A0L0RWU6_ALLM3|nr:VacB and RNase II family 3'-5' exoribonuclease [Allomyces macrogynus ATCC 38327]|eukprot:KNE54823.1 VacB and RNase II family 3'-5' exoribonuclease [Allomyces macrogynus ATCC 38327]
MAQSRNNNARRGGGRPGTYSNVPPPPELVAAPHAGAHVLHVHHGPPHSNHHHRGARRHQEHQQQPSQQQQYTSEQQQYLQQQHQQRQEQPYHRQQHPHPHQPRSGHHAAPRAYSGPAQPSGAGSQYSGGYPRYAGNTNSPTMKGPAPATTGNAAQAKSWRREAPNAALAATMDAQIPSYYHQPATGHNLRRDLDQFTAIPLQLGLPPYLDYAHYATTYQYATYVPVAPKSKRTSEPVAANSKAKADAAATGPGKGTTRRGSTASTASAHGNVLAVAPAAVPPTIVSFNSIEDLTEAELVAKLEAVKLHAAALESARPAQPAQYAHQQGHKQKRQYEQHQPQLPPQQQQQREPRERAPRRTIPVESAPKLYYPEWITGPALEEGLTSGKYLRGTLRINKRMRSDAYVIIDGTGDDGDDEDVFVYGDEARNRALEGDTVIIEIVDATEIMANKNKRMDALQAQYRSRAAAENPDGGVVDVAYERKLAASAAVSAAASAATSPDHASPDPIGAPTTELRRCGRVVAVVQRRSCHQLTGHLLVSYPSTGNNKSNINGNGKQDKSKSQSVPSHYQFLWFRPLDARVPILRVPVTSAPTEYLQRPDEFKHVLFTATMDDWPATARNPTGHIERTLGPVGEMATESEALLAAADVNTTPFSDEVIASLPSTPWRVSDEERAKRLDLMGECIFTIDPRTAKDLDDAVHVKVLDESLFEVGVHIADVSHFVLPGTALDERAADTCTTVYLVERAIPMLPNVLCQDLCSLNPMVERLAFSVIWQLRADGSIVDTRFGKSVIRSRAKLAYEDAQDIIEGRDFNPHVNFAENTDPEDIKTAILHLYKLSRTLRGSRFANGALTMNNIKLAFVLDKTTGMPIGCKPYPIRESNQLIEEFMLLANQSVATKISDTFPDLALLRRHAPPGDDMMKKLAAKALAMGYQIDVTSSGALQQSFDRISDPVVARLLKHLCVRPMKRAVYLCTGATKSEKQWEHYALAVPRYTHFTSPIRRYADVIVHRLLMAALHIDDQVGGSDAEQKEAAVAEFVGAHVATQTVADIAAQCNLRKLRSREAQDASSRLYLCQYLQYLIEARREATGIDAHVARARIIGIQDRSMELLVPSLGVEERAYYDKMPVSSFDQVDDANAGPTTTVIWKGSSEKQTLKMFDAVTVAVRVNTTVSPPKISLTVLDPTAEATKRIVLDDDEEMEAPPAPVELEGDEVDQEWVCNNMDDAAE